MHSDTPDTWTLRTPLHAHTFRFAGLFLAFLVHFRFSPTSPLILLYQHLRLASSLSLSFPVYSAFSSVWLVVYRSFILEFFRLKLNVFIRTYAASYVSL